MPLPSSGPLSLNDIQTEFGGTNPIGMNEYYAGGGLVPAGTTGTFGAVPSSGALSVQNFYGTSQVIPVYIEEVFSTYLYTGNGSTQTITNGIDLAGEGGLVWTKGRSTAQPNSVFDTVRGATNQLVTNSNAPNNVASTSLTAFNSNGFSLAQYGDVNTNGTTMVSWTFRKQPKFFDVVTFTIDGASSNQQVAHNLGSTPGCIFVKASNAAGDWFVYHTATGNNNVLFLNGTQAASAETGAWSASSTNFGIKSSALFGGGLTGKTAVAYLFAHNAGGFGLSGEDNVISCGSFTTDGSAVATVNLGYEPQWILIKNVQQDGNNWFMWDTMRGWTTDGTAGDFYLIPNSSAAEGGGADYGGPNATGFTIRSLQASNQFIYIAIRRGPMKTPTSGTSVFQPRDPGNAATTVITTNFPVDMQIVPNKKDATHNNYVITRLTGVDTTNSSTAYPYLWTESTNAQATATNITRSWSNTGYTVPIGPFENQPVFYSFRRAPGFFDEVCWTGDGTGNPRNHNLTVYPELVISKLRSGGAGFGAWDVQNNINPAAKQTGFLNTTAAFSSSGATSPTATVFYPTNDGSSATYVTYLFASAPGVSKVGSYTGTGATQTINCGFTGGARFVLIKATSTTGNWYVWDSARGIVAGNDPYLTLNTTAAEVTTTDWVDTAASGFELSNSGGNLANSNGVSYIFLAVA